jgi:hypothetical protein
MNIYKVRFGEEEGVFEYDHIINSSSLFEINKVLRSSNTFATNSIGKEYPLPSLNNNDMELMQSCGGTVIFMEDNSWIIHYLIDLDFKKHDPTADVQLKDEWKSKVRFLIESVKRDIKLNMIGV